MNIMRMDSYFKVTIKVPTSSGDSTNIYTLDDLTDVKNLLEGNSVYDMYGHTVSIPFENFTVEEVREVVFYDAMSENSGCNV